MSVKSYLQVSGVAFLSLALSTGIAAGQGQGHGYGREKHDNYDDADRDHGYAHGRGHDRYLDYRDQMRSWYREHYQNLPPGLAKRDRLPPGLERQLIVNGTLPPGLRRKMYPCPRELAVMLPPPPPNCAHFVIGGNLVLLNRVSFQIVDVLRFDLN